MKRLTMIAVAAMVPVLAGGQARASDIWNASADFDAGYAAGTNPNGAWTYGWTSNLTSGLNVYPSHHLLSAFPSFEAWDDPNHNAQLTPVVYKNTGSTYSDGNIDIPAGALILHGGGPSGNDYSDVVWTAPYSGTFSLAATFTGRQVASPPGNYQTNVYVLENGTTLFSNYLNTEGESGSFSGVLSLAAGATIVFADGIQGTGLHGESTQLDATISAVASAVPEPSTLTLGGISLFLGLAYAWHRRKAKSAA